MRSGTPAPAVAHSSFGARTGNAFSVEARVFREAGWVLAGTPTGSLRLYLGATVVQIDPDDKPEPSS